MNIDELNAVFVDLEKRGGGMPAGKPGAKPVNPNALRPVPGRSSQPFDPSEHPRYPVGHPQAGQFRDAPDNDPQPTATVGNQRIATAAEIADGKPKKVTGVLGRSNEPNAILINNISVNGQYGMRSHMNIRLGKDFAKDVSIEAGVGPGKSVIINGKIRVYGKDGAGHDKFGLYEITSIKLVK